MSVLVDNILAYRILSMLIRPFNQTDAFRLGIIDSKGKNLIKPSDLNTSEEKDAYTYLHRLVFNIKKLINKLPGGENKLKNIVTALYLIKEYYESGSRSTSQLEERFNALVNLDVVLAEETILVEKYMKALDEDGAGGGGGIVGGNVSGGIAGTTIDNGGPVVKKKDIEKYKKGAAATGPVAGLARRATPLA